MESRARHWLLLFIDASSVHAQLTLFHNTTSMVFYLARISTPLQIHAVYIDI
jgi:hypothetical protein